MSEFVLYLHAVAGGFDDSARRQVPSWEPGTYLVEYDPAIGLDSLVVSPDQARALRFPHAGAAIEYWRQSHPTIPTRPDGKPNRPLTCFTIEPVRVGDRPRF